MKIENNNNIQITCKEWTKEETKIVLNALIEYAQECAYRGQDGAIDGEYEDGEDYLDEAENSLLAVEEIFKVHKDLEKEFRDAYDDAYALADEASIDLQNEWDEYDASSYLYCDEFDLDKDELNWLIRSALDFKIYYESDLEKKEQLKALFRKYEGLCE